MNPDPNTTIRMFGVLYTLRRQSGLPPTASVFIPPEGRHCLDIAREVRLPVDKIEGVFINHAAYPPDRIIMPGDRVAFIPTGVPGSDWLSYSLRKNQESRH
jgi:hypothetical protein